VTALALQPDKPVIRRTLAENLLSCSVFEREDGEILAFGQAFHSFAAAYILQCQATNEETRLTDVPRLAAEAWQRTHGLLQSRFAEFINLCQGFAESHMANLGTLMHLEHTETLDVGWAVLTCTIDRIDRADMGDPDDEPRRELIEDYKTEEGEMDHTFQISWYSQMRLLKHPALEEILFQIDSIRGRYKAEPVVVQRGDLELWWRTTLAGLRERWEASPAARFPTGGPACQMCAKRYQCPKALAEARAIPENEDQADEVFEETLRMEESLAVRKKGLKVFYQDRAPRIAHGHEVGFLVPHKPHLVVTKSAKEVRSWLNRRHYDGDMAMKVDVDALEPVRDKLIESGMATLEYSKPGFRWRNWLPAKKARQAKAEEKESE